MRPITYLLLAFSMSVSAAALAAPAQTAGDEVRLSEAEKERVLEEAAAAARKQQSASIVDQATEADDPLPPPIHGEVGFTIGTGGYRSAYGTAIVPLDDLGMAIISLGTTDFGDRARIRPWWQ